MNQQLIIAILGPTASGKSEFSLKLAQKIGGEIICLDSLTVYRGMDVGTGKPTLEERQSVPHHLVDILNPDEPFSAFHFVDRAQNIIKDIESRGKIAVVVGGTYFYLRALQNGMVQDVFVTPEMIEKIEEEYAAPADESFDFAKMHSTLCTLDPESGKKIHPHDRYRLVRALAILKFLDQKPSELKPKPSEGPKPQWLKYAMLISRRELTKNITSRTELMLLNGLVDEVKNLRSRYPNARSLSSIGYCEANRFLEKEITDKQLRTEIIEKTRQLAKRQMTWIRHDPEIRFIDSRDCDRVLLELENLKYALETPP